MTKYVPQDQRRVCSQCGKNNAIKPARLCPTCKRANKKASKAKARNTRAMNVYGLKDGDYQKLWDNAPYGPGTCYICGGKGSGKLHIEHNHKTGAVRGLCCYTCNSVILARIGHDSVDRLEFLLGNAIKYLEEEPGQTILKDEGE